MKIEIPTTLDCSNCSVVEKLLGKNTNKNKPLLFLSNCDNL